MLSRLKISFKKDLNRIDFLINQLLCLGGIVLSFLSLYVLLSVAYVLKQEGYHTLQLISYGMMVLNLAPFVYFTLLWYSNIQGRFTNLGIVNKFLAWVLYIIICLLPYISILQYIIYLLPPNFFAKTLNKE